MDTRLPHRIREVRRQLLAPAGEARGRPCNTEAVREALCSAHPEYGRLKRMPLRRLIAQELSTPLPEEEATGGAAAEGRQGADAAAEGAAGAADGHGTGNKKRKKGAGSSPEADAAGAVNGPDPHEREALNGSLRRMYQRTPAAETSAAPAGTQPRTRPVARREQGLPEPAGSVFAPEARPSERLEDLGGIDSILADLRQLVVQPLAHPEVFAHLGVQPPTGVLLHGPPGSGKTKLAHALAGTAGVPFFKVAATEIVSGMSGESEAKIRQLFQAAIAAAPSLLFLDEVDAITPKRDSAGREMERRIVAQLLTCMDELSSTHVVVMGATNRPDALDPALRRAGRFDREIAMGIPNEAARTRILEKMVQGMRLAGDLDLAFLAQLTPGFVGADLSALSKEAALGAVARAFDNLRPKTLDAADGVVREDDNATRERPYTAEEMECLAVEMEDFKSALSRVQPSARREGFTTIPDVRWEDVGALQEVRADLEAAVCLPIRKAALFKDLGLSVPCGVLLFGPPGCGKTLLAKAIAHASGANFIAIKGPELLNKYVGESERAVRLVFQRATSSAPCVIFFDELDALVPRRSAEGSTSAERVVNQMLTEMDGVQQRAQVYVIAATNRPDIVDPAMLRPGRLDRPLFVPLPSEAGRLEILQAHTRRLPFAGDVDLKAVAHAADGFSGADLAALAREAAMLAIRAADVPTPLGGDHEMSGHNAASAANVCVTGALLAQARQRVSPSVGAEERRDYEALAARLCGWRRSG